MKNITILLLLITNIVFSQDISSPKPILSVYDTSTNQWVSFNNALELNDNTTSFQIRASFTDIGSTDSYRIEAIPYNPKPYARDRNFDGTIDSSDFDHGETSQSQGDVLYILADDQWSNSFNLKTQDTNFDFCFFGNQRNQFVISSNGIVSFNTAYSGQYSAWDIHNMGKIAPNANLGNNRESIILITDTDAIDSSALSDTYAFWNITGNDVGERYFIMGYHRMPLYSSASGCGNTFGYATYQMIFYETTNIIEYHILDKPICLGWPGSQYMAMGIQNYDLDLGFAAPGRDNLDHYQILDVTDGFYDGNFNAAYPINPPEGWRYVPNGNLGVTPVFSWYTDYNHANNTGTFVSNNPELTINPDNIPEAGTIYTAQIAYVSYCSGETYYATQNVTITVQIPTTAPTGDRIQVFYVGDNPTLADLIVFNTSNYNTIYWYDSPTCDGNLLPNTMPLADDTTYYASQTILSDDCSVDFLAVTVDIDRVLSIDNNQISNFKLQPNPVKDILNLEFRKANDIVKTTIYNIYGREVYKAEFYQNKTINISVSNLNSGVYFIRTQVENKTSTKKFIKI